MTTAIPTARHPAVSLPPTGFGATVASEWTKFSSLRSNRVMMALGIVLAVGLTALVSAGVGATWDDWSAADREDFDPALFPFVGGIISGILFSVLGLKIVTSEYSSGMMRLTLTATPRRARVLLAKVLVITVMSLVCGCIVTFGMFYTGQLVFSSYGLPTASLGDADTLRAVAAGCVLSPVFPVIGTALAVLIRGTAGAITSLLVLLFGPETVGALLPTWWQEHIVSLFPGPAGSSITIGHIEDSVTHLDLGPAIAVTVAWLVALVGAAYLALMARDA